MKKATKSTTTPAKPAPVPAKKSTVQAKPKTAATKTVKKSAAPTVKKSAPKAVNTTVVATIDVGFGNTLYLRGEGAGLSWEKGTAMDCVSDDKWSFNFGETAQPVVFKFLVNDLSWCTGDDFVAHPGTETVLTPVF